LLPFALHSGNDVVVTWGSSLWITNQRLFVVPEILEVQVIPSEELYLHLPNHLSSIWCLGC